MDNQHRKIVGYRELSQEEIDMMNEIKRLGPQMEQLVITLQHIETVDKRWVKLGMDHLQQGLMCLTRAVAQPTFF